MNYSDVFNFPAWSIPQEQQVGILAVACTLAVASLIYALWFSSHERSKYPIFIFLGAGLSVLYEPMGDVFTKVAYPPLEQISLFTSFGRPTPLWLLPNYFFFFCVPVLLFIQFVLQKFTIKRMWVAYGALVLFVGLFEQPGIVGDYWRYYGEVEAFSLNTYPVWVAFVNAHSIAMIATGVYLLRKHVLPERMSFLFIVLVPVLFVGNHIAPALPIVSALYTTTNLLLVNLAAILTISICVINVWIASTLVHKSKLSGAA